MQPGACSQSWCSVMMSNHPAFTPSQNHTNPQALLLVAQLDISLGFYMIARILLPSRAPMVTYFVVSCLRAEGAAAASCRLVAG